MPKISAALPTMHTPSIFQTRIVRDIFLLAVLLALAVASYESVSDYRIAIAIGTVVAILLAYAGRNFRYYSRIQSRH
jgi:hypothetical protein